MEINRAVVVFLFFLIVASNITGGEWARLGPDGGMATALAVHPTDPSLVFAGTVDGVYLSRDGGNSWARSSGGLTHLRITSIVIAPSSPNQLYVGTEGGGVFSSGDSAASWLEANQGLEGLFITAVAVDPLNPSTVYCSNLDLQTYQSLDGGGEWTILDDRSDETAAHGPTRHLAVAPSDPNRLYAGSSFRILKSSDGGLSWERADEGIDFGSHPSSPLAIHPANPDIVFAGTGNGLFRTTNGETWEPVTLLEASDLPIDTSEPVQIFIPIDAVAISPSAPDTVYTTAFSLVFKSEDGGRKWSSSFLIPTPMFGRSTDLAVDPADANTLFIGNQNGLFRSRNGGLGWTKLEKGLGSIGVQSLAFDPANPLALYCGTSLGVIKSGDGGQSWLGPPFGEGLISEIFLNGNQQGFRDLHIDPSNPRRILAAGGRLMGSRNGGREWSRTLNDTTHDILQDPSDPQILYLAATSQARAVYKSVDGGLTWTGKDQGLPRPLPSRFPPPVSALSLAVDPSDSSILWAGAPSGIYKSVDAAESWQFMAEGIPQGMPNPRPIPLPIPFPPLRGPGPSVPSIVIDPANPSTVYAAVQRGPIRESDRRGSVFKSEDGGISWVEAAQGLPGSGVTSLAIDPDSPQTLYAATWGDGVFRSLDGGLSWEPCSVRLGNPFVWRVLFHPHHPDRLYAGTEGGLFELQELPTPPSRPPVEVVQQVSGNLFAGGTAILEVSIVNQGESLIPDGDGDEFIEALPFGLMLASATADGGAIVLGPASDTVTWNGEIAAGQSVGIRIEARVEVTAQGRTLSSQGVALLDADGDGIKESRIPSDDPTTPQPDDPNTLLIEPDVLSAGILAVPHSLGIEGSFVGLAAVNPEGSPKELSVEALDGEGKLLSSLERGQLAALGQDAFLAREASEEAAALLVRGREGPIEGFFMMGDNDLARLDGIGGDLEDGQQLYLAEVRSSASSRTVVFLFNADTLSSSQVTMTLFTPDGSLVGESSFSLAPFGSLTADVEQIFAGLTGLEDGFTRLDATRPVRGFALVSDSETFSALPAKPARAVERLFSPHFFVEGGTTLLRVHNPHDRPLGLTVRVFDDAEGLIAEPRFEVPARQLMVLDSAMLAGAGSAARQGHLEVLLDGGSAGLFPLDAYPVASVVFEGASPATRSTLPLLERGETEVAFLQVAHSQELGIFQGLAILALSQGAGVTVLSIGSSGEFTAFNSVILRPNQRVVGLLDDPLFFGEGFSQTGGILLVFSSDPVLVYSLFGGDRFLSALEGRLR